MADGFFGDIAPVRYQGPTSDNPLCYRHYEASRLVHGKTMAEHLRPAVCYWHNFVYDGLDMFGAPTFERPWAAATMAAARVKADAAFDMFRLLGVPFFTFHDRDVVPEGANLAEFARNLARMVDDLRRQDAGLGGQAVVGHRQSLLAIRATWRARRPIPIRTSSPTRRRR